MMILVSFFVWRPNVDCEKQLSKLPCHNVKCLMSKQGMGVKSIQTVK